MGELAIPAAARLRSMPVTLRCRLAYFAGIAEITSDPDVVQRAFARHPGDPPTVSGMSPREQLWDRILRALPPRWRTARPTLDPGRHRWQVVAVGPKRGGRHGPRPPVVVGEGADELTALKDLATKLG